MAARVKNVSTLVDLDDEEAIGTAGAAGKVVSVARRQATGARRSYEDAPHCPHCNGRMHMNLPAGTINHECLWRQYSLETGAIATPDERVPVFTAEANDSFNDWIKARSRSRKKPLTYGKMESAGGGASTYAAMKAVAAAADPATTKKAAKEAAAATTAKKSSKKGAAAATIPVQAPKGKSKTKSVATEAPPAVKKSGKKLPPVVSKTASAPTKRPKPVAVSSDGMDELESISYDAPTKPKKLKTPAPLAKPTGPKTAKNKGKRVAAMAR